MIDLNDLRHSINQALNLGRYQIVVKTAGGEQVPASITLDLLERDDDLFGPDDLTEFRFGPEGDAARAAARESTASVLARVNTALDAEDDHGPTVPAQGLCWDLSNAKPYDGPKFEPIGQRPRIYEFALQDIRERPIYAEAGIEITLANAELCDAPDIEAVDRADWVHVFDRVTRERRTLKRPEPDAVLKGLNDVAADLRGRGGRVTADYANTERGEEVFTAPKRGDPVDPPFGCYTPPVGPLTSTDGLKVGDVLRSLVSVATCRDEGYIARVEGLGYEGIHYVDKQGCKVHTASPETFAFVARPGVWMPWSGGENPVPGMDVMIRYDDHPETGPHPSGALIWARPWSATLPELNVAAFMVIDTGKASSDT